MFTERDQFFMQRALMLAEQGANAGEVPVGAVLVLNDAVLSEGFNAPISNSDPTAHAEIVVLRLGAERISNYRLVDATLYVTLEPCAMCAGAMVHARIKRLVYGTLEPKAGAIVSKAQALDQLHLNHRVVHAGGLLADECSVLLSQFFRDRR